MLTHSISFYSHLKAGSESKHEVKEQDEEIDIDLSDPGVEAAAVKIQNSFRRHLSKQNVSVSDKGATSGEDGPEGPGTSEQASKNEEEEVDIDLNDPEVADAAAKIQAGFKKHMMKKKKWIKNDELKELEHMFEHVTNNLFSVLLKWHTG